jgi:O-succinylbenzoic acid--CoA ligase
MSSGATRIDAVLATPAAASELLEACAQRRSVVLIDPRLSGEEQRSRRSVVAGTCDVPSAVLFTSGTTAQARPVVLPWELLEACAAAVVEAVDLRSGDRWFCPLPLSHVGGLAVLLRCDQAGATAVLGDFSVSALADELAAGATHVSLVGRMLSRLLSEVPGAAAPALRLAMVGGGPTDPDLIARARAAGLAAVTTYGLTEAGSTVTLGRLDTLPTALGDAGWAVPGRELRIEDDGRLAVRGAGLVDWVDSGDYGRIEPDGRLIVADRRVDRIVTGGENVAPGEVERVLETAPGVLAVCVVGLPDRQWGQRVVAAVRWEGEPRRDELRACATARLLPWQRPRQLVDWRGEFPRGALGKLLRHRVREALSRSGERLDEE